MILIPQLIDLNFFHQSLIYLTLGSVSNMLADSETFLYLFKNISNFKASHETTRKVLGTCGCLIGFPRKSSVTNSMNAKVSDLFK